MATEQPKEAAEAAPPAPVQEAESTPTTTTTTTATTQQTPPTTQEQPAPPAAAPKQETTFIHEDPSTAPDPDEDDLSDLDDVLDEFAATNISSHPSSSTAAQQPAPLSSGPGRPPAGESAAAELGGAGPGGLFASEDEFAKAMQAGMAELLGEFEGNPDMARQFEELVKELGEGMGAAGGSELGIAPPPEDLATAAAATSTPAASAASAKATSSATTATATAKAAETPKPASAAAAASFEDSIRATMERMNASSKSASDAASKSASNPEEDFLAAMLREMESSSGGAGLGSDEDFSKMLMGMMEQLTNKEILYEPMKELHDKFPAWMKENEGKVPKEDWDRYVEQKKLVAEIVAKFDDPGYADGKVEYREYIVERMQQMQAAGSPPPDLVGDMNAAQEALGDLDAGCPQQ